jgi:predicted RNA-binding protein
MVVIEKWNLLKPNIVRFINTSTNNQNFSSISIYKSTNRSTNNTKNRRIELKAINIIRMISYKSTQSRN